MPSTYTSNNKIQKIATGEQSGTWGNTTNTNFDLFDTAIDGFVNITLSGTTHTLNIPDGSAGDGRNKVLVFTGTLAATNTISVTPNTVKKHYYVQNNTTGSQNIVLSQGSGSSVTIKPGYSSIVYLDGAGSGAAVKEVLTSLKLTALLEATGAVLNGSSSGSTTLQASATASGTLTLPAATDTLVGKATTDTFTNKTFDTAGTGNVLRINGTQVSAVTGTGSVVLATSPTLVTPLLGTPTSGTLTNCTGLPVSSGISGLGTNVATFLATPSSANLAAAVTDETGTGALVFGTSPTIATPTITTSAVIPVVNGGTAASSVLTLQSTSGAGTTDSIVFRTASQLERMRVNTAGDINIGSANDAGNTLRFFDIFNTNTGSIAGVIARLITSDVAGTSTAVGQIIKYKNGTMLIQNSETDAAASMQFYVGASERVRITSSGNVGIGTSSPAANARLDVQGGRSYFSANSEAFSIFLRYNASTNGVFLGSPSADAFQVSKSSGVAVLNIDSSGNVGIGTGATVRSILNTSVGTVTGPTVTAGFTLSAVYSGTTAVNTIDWNYSGQNASPVRLGATFNSDGNGMEMVFYTSTAFNTTGSERMRLDKDGRLGIGTTAPDALLTVNTIASFGDGAVTTPSIAHKGDLNTGFWFPAVDTIAASTAGSERMRIDSSGNVGIGTTPSYRLHVANNADATVTWIHLLKNDGGSADGVYIVDDRGFSGVNSGKTLRVLTRDNGGNDTGAVASFETLSQTVLRVGIDGRVGVGTAAPATSAKMDIDSTTGALLVPRMTTTQRDALTAVNGMIIYNTTTNTMQGRINGAWADM